jgi:uncharacterized protein YbaR (Trm112 family)
MFIELTDHLRCVAEHDESFVVLLPDEVVDRSVRRGTLGCPVCGAIYQIRDGVLEAGEAAPPSDGEGVPSGEALAALAGLGGPGGYMVLAGAAGARWGEVSAAVPGVHVVLVNPPAGVEEATGMSVLRSSRLPLQSRSMRAVVLGAPYGGDPAWVAEAARVVLPGLRVVGHGAAPATEALELLADAEGWWVAQRARR